ncbi:uncharacterized protein J4E88_004825 [Alternaria novae-zelandiae]|uniref:uncharacterized protein n=1 Tax=Alternaria viburni TaxID=566460 RepID=UPI0020C59DFB|nr:uncharacterized protein J4E79_001105 [Alternaria viburni]XP_049226766.1 uncharacterized protein J4E78_000822 [Alternaria triticimaculans]XP_049256029.1 uncharacterized protein J4E88_004825 [Alternaria novae-zelandiae]XP_051357754.1 uncharacterized protein J4E92_000828 [Alternaria infectoria]KAI4682562.1 hypothetical protein J4E81_009637 [Alternaria sp. BMP 2799]KAI4669062.1 hypothetical protein J4E79_001105 [Alternaria viburni]KAI4672321.1 hypothetical protein J4E78_000822 [Alternaria trit
MATFLNSPCTPAKPAHTFYHDDSASRSHKANLSGATMLDLLSGPEGSIAAAYESSSVHQRSSRSRRPSQTSITKSQLRQTNRTLIEIIHNVQAELATQREAMLDMQTRILQLESASQIYNQDLGPRHTIAGHRKRSQIRSAEGAARETQGRWDAYQKDVDMLGPPLIANEFWKSPSRFSGFNFNFDLLETIPKSLHPPPPDVDDVPSLSPDEQPETYTPGLRRIPARITRIKTSDPTTMYHDAVSDIKEHVVEFDKINAPMPVKLQTPPRSSRSKLTSMYSRDDEITALPRIPFQPAPSTHNSHRSLMGIKSLLLYRTSSRSQKSDYPPSDHRRSGSSLRC